jgi:uncharacterized RDD family membrane protein YckC
MKLRLSLVGVYWLSMFCTRCGATNADLARFCSGCGSPLEPATVPGYPAPAAIPRAPAFRYSGFWRRFVAMVIDSFVFTPIAVALLATTGIFGILLHPSDDFEGMMAAMLGVSIIAVLLLIFAGSWLYHTLMESSRYQATLGKLALGSIVTDLDGRRISFARANGRFFGKMASSAIFNIGYIMAGFTEKKQALHDILAGTLVVQK